MHRPEKELQQQTSLSRFFPTKPLLADCSPVGTIVLPHNFSPRLGVGKVKPTNTNMRICSLHPTLCTVHEDAHGTISLKTLKWDHNGLNHCQRLNRPKAFKTFSSYSIFLSFLITSIKSLFWLLVKFRGFTLKNRI